MKLLSILLILATVTATSSARDLPFYVRLNRPLKDKGDTLIIDRLNDRSAQAILNGERVTGVVGSRFVASPPSSGFNCSIRFRIPGKGFFIGRFTRTVTKEPITAPGAREGMFTTVVRDRFKGRASTSALLRPARHLFTFTGKQVYYPGFQ